MGFEFTVPGGELRGERGRKADFGSRRRRAHIRPISAGFVGVAQMGGTPFATGFNAPGNVIPQRPESSRAVSGSKRTASNRRSLTGLEPFRRRRAMPGFSRRNGNFIYSLAGTAIAPRE
jgi:hypothetical protein